MTFNFCCKNSRSMTKRKNVFLMTDLGLSARQNGLCKRAGLQQYGSSHTDSQRFPGGVVTATTFLLSDRSFYQKGLFH